MNEEVTMVLPVLVLRLFNSLSQFTSILNFSALIFDLRPFHSRQPFSETQLGRKNKGGGGL